MAVFLFNFAPNTPNRCDCQQPTQRRAHTCRPLAYAKDLESRNDHPVKERRFFKPGVAAESRSDQIAAEKHLARHLRIARLVWSNQGQLAQTVQVKRDNDCYKENGDSLGKR